MLLTTTKNTGDKNSMPSWDMFLVKGDIISYIYIILENYTGHNVVNSTQEYVGISVVKIKTFLLGMGF